MIRPPSDIVLDVARAADPARLAQAQAKLGGASAPAMLAGDKPTAFDVALREVASTRASGRVAPGAPDAAGRAYRGLEEVLLARLVEAMLPNDAKSFYGSGTAGRVWRGFLAEQIARSVAEGGGVGVAARLAPPRAGAAPA